MLIWHLKVWLRSNVKLLSKCAFYTTRKQKIKMHFISFFRLRNTITTSLSLLHGWIKCDLWRHNQLFFRTITGWSKLFSQIINFKHFKFNYAKNGLTLLQVKLSALRVGIKVLSRSKNIAKISPLSLSITSKQLQIQIDAFKLIVIQIWIQFAFFTFLFVK